MVTNQDPRLQELKDCIARLAELEITHAGKAEDEIKKILKERAYPIVSRHLSERLDEYNDLAAHRRAGTWPPPYNSRKHLQRSMLDPVMQYRNEMITFLESLCRTLDLDNKLVVWSSVDSSKREQDASAKVVCPPTELRKEEGVSPRNAFRRTNDHWEISYERGKSFTMTNKTGMLYIAMLLRRPGYSYHVLELLEEVRGKDERSDTRDYMQMCEAELNEQRLSIVRKGHQYHHLDEEALRSYEEHLTKIQHELPIARAEGNWNLVHEYLQDTAAIKDALKGAGGLGKRRKAFPGPVQQAMWAVTSAIGRCLERIKEKDENLWSHLYKTLPPLGFILTYKADPPIHWTTE